MRNPRRTLSALLLAAALPAALAQTTTSTAAEDTVKLEEFRVLGSLIRQTDTAGPSPVSVYGTDIIASSGAFTLADFLNTLPQNYAGISAGRGSAPNELNPEFGQRTETTTPAFNLLLGASAAPPGQTGVSGVSLRGLGSGSTLVLVDGKRVAQTGGGNRSTDSRQGFVDLNTIPLGMIERIEVITDGSSALYGADAVAGVINIVLKKNWVGNELSLNYRGAFDGGGHERRVGLTSGFVAGKLRGVVSLDYYDRADLKASERPFSANQDHRSIVVGTDASGNPVFGRDFRLLWGYPAVVQAQGGTVAGNFDAIPGVRVVLVPEGAVNTPTVAQFIPVTVPASGTVVNASGQRRGNTAEFLDLISPSERRGANIRLDYPLTDHVDAYVRYSNSQTEGVFSTQPGVSSASASSGFGNFSTLIPAALNPFNQNVIVGMIHYEFGSVKQWTETIAHSAYAGINGRLASDWQWSLDLGWQRQDFNQLRRDFNGSLITAALTNPDPLLRLNPFVDARTGRPSQAHIYEPMALYTTLDTLSKLTTADLTADGPLFDIWGGAVKMAVGVSYEDAENGSTAVNRSVAVTPVVTTTTAAGQRESYAAFAELAVPLFGKPNAKPLLRRLEFQFAGRYEDRGDAGTTSVPKIGFSWVPIESLLLRGSYAEGFRAPALTEYQVVTPSFNTTLTDPRRTPTSTTGVVVSRGSNPGIQPETSTNEFLGAVIEPTFLPGFNLQVNYYRTIQENVIQVLSAQNIVNNESLFPGRVTRAAPDANDIALGQPGRITAVDTTLINFGEVRNESLDFTLEYRVPWDRFGRWRLSGSAARTLEATRQLAPGQPPVSDENDTFAPPKWKLNGAVYWSQGPWTASVSVAYLSGFATNRAGNSFTATYPIPSQVRVDARVGYEFKEGAWRGWGKGLRAQVGIGNVFDEDPPFSDTVFGYNGALHNPLGRTYELSMVLPF